MSHRPTHRLVPRPAGPPADQLSLLEPTEDESIDARFAAFHAEHPEVYRELVNLARRGIEVGELRLGIGMLFEVLRWNNMVRPGTEEFRLNNVYRSRYARLIMANEPDLAGVFETRALPSRSAA